MGQAGGGSGGGSSATRIEFVPPARLELAPKESRVLTVQVTPAGSYPVRFDLIEGATGPADAVLSQSEVQSDANGTAQVTFIAPSKPASFNVRASITAATQVQLGVTVNASGFTSLRVLPSYSGQRTVTDWTATVSSEPGLSCSTLTGNPPADGKLQARAKVGKPLEFTGKVPIGLDLVVTVRAGHFIGGCANLPALSEGEGNQVLIYASDRPLNLADTELSVSLGASDPHVEFDKLLKASAAEAENALLGAANDDVAALLDGMRDATPLSSREAFSGVRMQNGWDSALENAFGKTAARRLRDPAQRWLSAGLLTLNAPDALLGTVTAKGSAASFELRQVGSASPSDAGFDDRFAASWSADSSDTLILGTDLSWVPSRLATALALDPARLEFPEATSSASALALAVDCAQVGNVLAQYGVTPGIAAFGTCDQSCTAALCRTAVASAWAKAEAASGDALATLSITATGAAQVGDDAEATAVVGSWVGELQTLGGAAPVSGALTASSAR